MRSLARPIEKPTPPRRLAPTATPRFRGTFYLDGDLRGWDLAGRLQWTHQDTGVELGNVELELN
jgi:hypothetical protein